MRRPESRFLPLLLVACLLAGAAAASDKAKPRKGGALSEGGRAELILVQAYLDAGKLSAAQDRARAALASDPGSALVHATMAIIHSRTSEQGKAKSEFERAIKIDPNDGAVLNAYGSWLCQQGQTEQADQAFVRALKDPRFQAPAQVLANAGRCASQAGNWSRGEGYLRRAVQIAPRDRGLLLMLAEAELRLGRAMDARAFVQRADALGPNAATLALAARVEDATGDHISAAHYRKRLQEAFPAYVPRTEAAAKP